MSEQQQKKKQQRETLKGLLALHTNPKPLVPHELVSTPQDRREGLHPITDAPPTTAACRWTEDITSLALEGCPYDEYLGLRFYHQDPIPWIQRACQSANKNANSSNNIASSSQNQNQNQKLMFVDHEFPVHEMVYLKVAPSPGEMEIQCIPGVITSSNCRDFRTDPKNRLKRIQNFVRKAKLVGGGMGREGGGGSSWNWVRGSSMENCSLFSCSSSSSSSSSSSVDPRNIVQGEVGNCGFCSGFVSIAAGWPHVLIDAFGTNENQNMMMDSNISLSECGAVSILLFPCGEPRYLLMDDYVVCSSGRGKRNNNCNNNNDNNNGRMLRGEEKSTSLSSSFSPSVHSVIDNDLWVRLLEKAFVKIQGSYASLDGHYKYNSLYRHPARAMQLLTGAPVALEVHYNAKKVDIDIIYDILAKTTQGNCARVVHCRKRVDGLVSNHGYSLLWVGEGCCFGSVVDSTNNNGADRGGVRLACLRNPHGKGSYTGKYGFGRPVEELRSVMVSGRKGGSSSSSKRGGGVASSSSSSSSVAKLPKCFAVCQKTGRITWQQQRQEVGIGGGGGGCHPAFNLRNEEHDNGIFFMEFGKFVECFPKATIVGPIRRSRAANDGTQSGEGASNRSAALLSGPNSHVPDCIHIVKSENLAHVVKIFETASGL